MSVTATQARSRYPTLTATAFAEFDEKTAASSEQQYAAEDQADAAIRTAAPQMAATRLRIVFLVLIAALSTSPTAA
jgi:hypothetical protein